MGKQLTFLSRTVDSLLASGIPPSDMKTHSALVRLVLHGSPDTLRSTLEREHFSQEEKNQAFRLAAREGRVSQMLILCEFDADFFSLDEEDWTAASTMDADSGFVYQLTAMIALLERGNFSAVRNAVDDGFDINMLDGALLASCLRMELSSQAAFLLELGASASAVTEDDVFPLLRANDVRIIEMLIKAGVDLVGEFHIPLLVACMAGARDVAYLLLNAYRYDTRFPTEAMSAYMILGDHSGQDLLFREWVSTHKTKESAFPDVRFAALASTS